MKWILTALYVSLIAAFSLCAQEPPAPLQTEMGKLDALAANPELKLVVVAAMADNLQIHRNHLLLLRKDTGQPFATIFVSQLRSRGLDDDAILRTLRALRRKVERQLAGDNALPGAPGLRPVLLLGSSVDHNSAGTIYSLTPEFGFDSSHIAAVVGIPYYRTFNPSVSSGGVGDVYASVFLRGRTAGFDLGSIVTAGAPTGDRNLGLGAGKATFDVTGTVARQLKFARPWISAGFANSIFDNAGYQRPYVTDGNAAHFGGGVDFAIARKLNFGLGGFGLEPVGKQVVYSQTMQSGSQTGGGMMGGGMGAGMGSGMGNDGSVPMPPASSTPFYDNAQQSVVDASQLRDYGPSLWLSVPLHPGFSLNTAVARSLPFHLTTVRVGIEIDVARLLLPGKHF